MSDCVNDKCKCERMCYVLNQCVFTHPLLQDRRERLLELLAGKLHENDKTRRVLHLFYEVQPPKCPYKKKTFPISKASRKKPQAKIPVLSVVVTEHAETIEGYLTRKYNEPETPNFHEQKLPS